MKMIIQKFIAQSGYCSRRKAERLVAEQETIAISVNGQPAQIGQLVDESDEITINGEKIGLPKDKIYIKLNKPVGYVCTNARFKGEESVFALLPEDMVGLTIAGRLDKSSRGLVILTNDGEWALKLTHPRYGHEKKYLIKISSGEFWVTQKEEDFICKKFVTGVGIGEGDGLVKAKRIEYLGSNKFEVVLSEGKKRQIRRMFKKLGFEVKDLERIEIGSVKLGKLEEGEWEYIKTSNS